MQINTYLISVKIKYCNTNKIEADNILIKISANLLTEVSLFILFENGK